MNQEQLPQPAEQQPSSREGIRPSPQSSRKGVILFLGFGLVIVIIIVVVARYALPKFALANFEPTLKAKTAPLSASPAKISEHATEGPAARPLGQQTPPSAEGQAQNFWAAFEKSVWGAPLEEWSRLHPDVPCEPFRGHAWGLEADRDWSHRCSASSLPEAAHWSFYVFGPHEPFVPRLEQFDVTTDTLLEEALGDLEELLHSRIAARFGPGEDRSGPRPVITHQPTWPRDLRWQAPDLEIQLSLVEFDPQRMVGRLRLQGRHRPLLEAMNEDNRLQSVGKSDESYEYYRTGSGIDAKLADNLRPDFPDVANMLMKDRPDPDPQTLAALQEQQRKAFQEQLQKQREAAKAGGRTGPYAAFAVALPQADTNWKAEEFHAALVHLLEKAKTSPPDRQPIMLWAADRLAERLPSVIANDKSRDWKREGVRTLDEWQTQLASLGVAYQPATDEDAPLAYTGSILKRIWTDYGQSEWGERAFLVLQGHGWDMGDYCNAGAEQFRTVIQQGLPFLEQHPKSPYQLDVQLAVAQAYETWWSISLPPIPGQTVTAEEDSEPLVYQRYQEGAEEARQKAIAYYERLLQTAPQSDHAAYARRVLPRLELGVDTGQRRYYCIFDD
jgi:hypothetical protein